MFGIDDIIGAALKIVDKVLPDPQAKMQAQIQIMQLKQNGDFKELEAQLQQQQMQADINRTEASNSSVFVAGWRPFVGWVCGSALSFQFIIRPLLTWIAALAHHPVAVPTLDMGDLITLLLGMLGLGAARTIEKVNGIGKDNG